MKSIALLATALFLATAPAPDSDTISEFSAGFLSSNNAQPLMAAEPEQTIQQVQKGFSTSTAFAAGTPVKEPLRQTVKTVLLAD